MKELEERERESEIKEDAHPQALTRGSNQRLQT